MRLAFLLVLAPALACGLESGGLGPSDGGMKESSLEDRGTGMNEAGMTCACVPNPGTGWKFVAYVEDGSDPCPGEFGMQRFAVEENQIGPATCSCTCGAPTANSTCVINSVTLNAYLNNNCANNPDSTFNNIAGGCVDLMPDYNPSGVVSVKGTAQITPQGGMCAAGNVTTTVPSDLHKGQACVLTAAMGSGCSTATDVCVPKASTPFGLCVAIDQANATCPANYPKQHKVGVGKMDSRACSACTCLPDPICNAQVTFDDSNGCNGNKQGQSAALDNACHVVVNSGGFKGHSIISDIATVTQRCTQSGGAMPTGSVSLDTPYTICCP